MNGNGNDSVQRASIISSIEFSSKVLSIGFLLSLYGYSECLVSGVGSRWTTIKNQRHTNRFDSSSSSSYSNRKWWLHPSKHLVGSLLQIQSDSFDCRSSFRGKSKRRCGRESLNKRFFSFWLLDDGYCPSARLWQEINSRNCYSSTSVQQVSWIVERWRFVRSIESHRLFSADIIELFEAFNEQGVRRNLTIVRLILAAWSISLMQFTLVVTSTRTRKERSAAYKRRDSRDNDKCFSCRLFWETELWVNEEHRSSSTYHCQLVSI